MLSEEEYPGTWPGLEAVPASSWLSAQVLQYMAHPRACAQDLPRARHQHQVSQTDCPT